LPVAMFKTCKRLYKFGQSALMINSLKVEYNFTHTRTHTRTHARTHARTHTPINYYKIRK